MSDIRGRFASVLWCVYDSPTSHCYTYRMSAKQSCAIWIVDHNDDAYPTRFKDRLKDHSPPLIYSCGDLSEAALVVNSDYEKGGSWAGAVEQLEKYRFVPVYVRTSGDVGQGLEALQRKGALPWTNPTCSDDFEALLDHTAQVRQPSSSEQLSFL
jgi:predicted Rossmann fold nucleotide-binding protein DprA/Smf involved in DNA uptake